MPAKAGDVHGLCGLGRLTHGVNDSFARVPGESDTQMLTARKGKSADGFDAVAE